MPLDLDAIEREGDPDAGPFTVTVAGARYTLADPVGLPWRAIAHLGSDIEHDVHTLFGDQAEQFRRHPMPVWKLNRLVDAWKEHYALGGSVRLVALLERYGQAIEADLADRQVDLAQLWSERRWRRLLNLVDQLPTDSRTLVAMAEDEELTAALPEPEPGPPPPPPLRTWTPEVEKLTLIADRLGELITAVHNTVAKRPGRSPRPLPRPETARDRIKRQRRRAKYERLKAQLAAAAAEGRPTMADVQASTEHTAGRLKTGGSPACS
ncbi:hypothetical protein [Streptomyces kebangsaanensis]|uniref:hypothetical protein n=1 Tax=Streptomyces kebangsaanensis TaxID=864058 RepID=UPI00093AB17A|nr:hypothetical protein [Streptomyces kebangsaanensis]